MPVNLTAPDADSLLPVAGVELGTARAGIRKPGRRDLLVVRLLGGDNERIQRLQQQLWAALRPAVMGLDPSPPRIWST